MPDEAELFRDHNFEAVKAAAAQLSSERAVAPPSAIHPMLALAIEKGLGVDGIERLVALAEREADRNAAREFMDAMAAFQAECPPIRKTSEAEIVTKSGARFAYSYAELDEIARTIRPLLHKHGLMYAWDSALEQGGMRVTCSVAHVGGHRVSASFTAPLDPEARMSAPQRSAASLTYGRRQSLIQALGLTTTDPDTDAARENEKITPDEVLVIEALLEKRPDGARAALLKHLRIGAMEEMDASTFKWAKRELERKIAADGQ